MRKGSVSKPLASKRICFVLSRFYFMAEIGLANRCFRPLSHLSGGVRIEPQCAEVNVPSLYFDLALTQTKPHCSEVRLAVLGSSGANCRGANSE
jgi:hypothetical protein